ncbi:serine/threonine-protein kinase [Aeromonas sp. MrichA-1]|uniref:serine/threonine protein kinase n=1 Tax=Aeromonas sp. MrichA-1 TaxID=2823362 RepID=UPI001B321C82|nr:serine/threonine-protein kinase [Aeromonas sp. MrichA-1]MBP4081622.1 serine/threonine protein kinase [Aeromonas sp. MrichA-1]
MRVYVSGNNKAVVLEQKDFVFSGGEGKVFVKGDIAYKIYHDSSKVIEQGRIEELSKISSPFVIKPESMLLDDNNRPIGYSMRALHNTLPLSRLFTTEFRTANNISDQDVYTLLQQMRDTLSSLHKQGILIVDGNEMNYLVSSDFKSVYWIDVDSYQTASYPAKAYSESTLDPLVDVKKKNFSSDSDWFAFGIIATQLLVGIHPFKGTYKGSSHSFKRGDVVSRMAKAVSIFHADVSVNNAVRDFSVIPQGYKQWLTAMFEEKKRMPAPMDMVMSQVSQAVHAAIISSALNMTEVFSSESVMLDVYCSDQKIAYKTDSYFVADKVKIPYSSGNTHLVFSPRTQTPILVKIKDGKIMMQDTKTKQVYEDDFNLKSFFVYQNRIYGVSEEYIQEISLHENQNKMVIVSGVAEAIMPRSTELYTNVLVQHMMGAMYLTIPSMKDVFLQIRIPEMESKRIINAKYESGVLILVSLADNGDYIHSCYKINQATGKYEWLMEKPSDDASINFAVLDNGIAVVEDSGTFSIFSNEIGKSQVKVVVDPSLVKNIKLSHHRMMLFGIDGNELYHLSMK